MRLIPSDLVWQVFGWGTPGLGLICVLLGVQTLKLTAPVFQRIWRRKRASPKLSAIDEMSGAAFERALHELFEKQGFRVQLTAHCGDYGADLVLLKEGKRVVVQAKRWKSVVGIKAVQEVLGARDKYEADEAWVVTNSNYTNAAREQARVSGVKLLDRAWLVRSLKDAA